jgi:hypothetical protein
VGQTAILIVSDHPPLRRLACVATAAVSATPRGAEQVHPALQTYQEGSPRGRSAKNAAARLCPPAQTRAPSKGRRGFEKSVPSHGIFAPHDTQFVSLQIISTGIERPKMSRRLHLEFGAPLEY